MGVRFNSVQASNSGVSLVTTAETIVLTSPPFTPAQDSAAIVIFGRAIITPGTTTSGIILRIRRGTTLTGPQLQQAAPTIPATAALQGGFLEWYIDAAGFGLGSSSPVSGVQYVLTATQVAATANGTLNDGAIFVFAL